MVCAVTAIVPGYKSKTTVIWLKESATNVNFELDPEVFDIWDMNIIWGTRLEVYLLMIVVAGFLMLLSRRTIRRLQQRQLSRLKRPVEV